VSTPWISIRRPRDARSLFPLHAFLVHRWYGGDDALADAADQAVDEITRDIGMIDADVPGMVTAYAEGIGDPLARLSELGLAVAAVRFQSGGLDTVAVIVAPDGMLFAGQDRVVHRFPSACQASAAIVTTAGSEVRSWADDATAEIAFEGSVPWCPECALGAR
jgi:hypothetical protein